MPLGRPPKRGYNRSRAEAEAAKEKYENEQAKLSLIIRAVAGLFIAACAGGLVFWLMAP